MAILKIRNHPVAQVILILRGRGRSVGDAPVCPQTGPGPLTVVATPTFSEVTVHPVKLTSDQPSELVCSSSSALGRPTASRKTGGQDGDVKGCMLMAAQTGGAATLPTVRGMVPCRGIRLSSRPSRPPYNECEIRRSWSSREALTLWGVGLRTASWGRTETRRQLALYSTTARLQYSQPGERTARHANRAARHTNRAASYATRAAGHATRVASHAEPCEPG